MKFASAALMIWIGQMGCGSTYDVSSSPNAETTLSMFNADAHERSGVIVFRDDSEVEARSIVASQDSTRFLNESTGSPAAVSTQMIRRVVFKNRLVGLLEWAGIGAVVVGVLGMTLSAHQNDASGVGAAYAILGGPVGAFFGGIGGVIVGHTYAYDFVSTSRDTIVR